LRQSQRLHRGMKVLAERDPMSQEALASRHGVTDADRYARGGRESRGPRILRAGQDDQIVTAPQVLYDVRDLATPVRSRLRVSQ